MVRPAEAAHHQQPGHWGRHRSGAGGRCEGLAGGGRCPHQRSRSLCVGLFMASGQGWVSINVQLLLIFTIKVRAEALEWIFQVSVEMKKMGLRWTFYLKYHLISIKSLSALLTTGLWPHCVCCDDTIHQNFTLHFRLPSCLPLSLSQLSLPSPLIIYIYCIDHSGFRRSFPSKRTFYIELI